MKYDHNKSYGYPILRPILDDEPKEGDYVGYSFEPSFSPRILAGKPGIVRIEVETYLQEETLRLAVVEKQAKVQLILLEVMQLHQQTLVTHKQQLKLLLLHQQIMLY